MRVIILLPHYGGHRGLKFPFGLGTLIWKQSSVCLWLLWLQSDSQLLGQSAGQGTGGITLGGGSGAAIQLPGFGSVLQPLPILTQDRSQKKSEM